MKTKWAVACAVGAIASGFAVSASAACLTNSSDAVGNAVFGATVGTFQGLGIDANTTCISNDLWTDPAGGTFGSYVGGAEGVGFATNPASLGAYALGGSPAAAANARDFAWVQDTSPNAYISGINGSAPSQGIIWDLGGQANQVAVFVFVDHGPVPGEVLENTAWLSNDPTSADALWTQAHLTAVYGGGWSADPNIADGFVALYQLPDAATFRYVSVTWGGLGAVVRDGDDEIDAVMGLTQSGGCVGANCGGGTSVPEPGSLALLGLGLAGLGFSRRRKVA
jgi:hypothetical protein